MKSFPPIARFQETTCRISTTSSLQSTLVPDTSTPLDVAEMNLCGKLPPLLTTTLLIHSEVALTNVCAVVLVGVVPCKALNSNVSAVTRSILTDLLNIGSPGLG